MYFILEIPCSGSLLLVIPKKKNIHFPLCRDGTPGHEGKRGAGALTSAALLTQEATISSIIFISLYNFFPKVELLEELSPFSRSF